MYKIPFGHGRVIRCDVAKYIRLMSALHTVDYFYTGSRWVFLSPRMEL